MQPAWNEDKQAVFFTQGFVGQQIDLQKYSKPYWQPKILLHMQYPMLPKWGRVQIQSAVLVSWDYHCNITQ